MKKNEARDVTQSANLQIIIILQELKRRKRVEIAQNSTLLAANITSESVDTYREILHVAAVRSLRRFIHGHTLLWIRHVRAFLIKVINARLRNDVMGQPIT